MKKYKHISQQERELIFLYYHQGRSYREIAKILGRNHRSIAREIKRNSSINNKSGKLGYSSIEAQQIAITRRAQAKVGARKLDDPVLKKFVIRKIGVGWSPEQIAGRIKRINPALAICPETIYQFVYRKENKKLKLWELLRRRHKKRQHLYGRRAHKGLSIPNRVFIENRPKEANQRSQIGHWETDLMEGKRKHKSHVSVVIDRKSRLVKLNKVNSKQAKHKVRSLIDQLNNLPREFTKTITYDNGKENFKHQQVARKLGCKNYFCNPYHSWEKGTVENIIGLVRQYLPKGTNLETVTQGDLSWIARLLNDRPRKTLDYQTPAEIFTKETGWVT